MSVTSFPGDGAILGFAAYLACSLHSPWEDELSLEVVLPQARGMC